MAGGEGVEPTKNYINLCSPHSYQTMSILITITMKKSKRKSSYACTVCGSNCEDEHYSILCNICNKWCHADCLCGEEEIKVLYGNDDKLEFYCPPCAAPAGVLNVAASLVR